MILQKCSFEHFVISINFLYIQYIHKNECNKLIKQIKVPVEIHFNRFNLQTIHTILIVTNTNYFLSSVIPQSKRFHVYRLVLSRVYCDMGTTI